MEAQHLIQQAVLSNNVCELREIMESCKDCMDSPGMYPSDFLQAIRKNLTLSAEQGYTEVAEYLYNFAIFLGEDPETSNTINTPLMLTSEAGHIQAVELLLNMGCNVNWEDMNTRSSLHWAALDGHHATVSLLLHWGAHIDLQDRTYGVSPLMLASRQGHVKVVQLLIDHGSSVNLTAKDGETALFEATRNNQIDCVKLLVEHGANINQQDSKNRTPILIAVLWKRVDIARILIQANCDLEVCAYTHYAHRYTVQCNCKEKYTPFQAALMECRFTIAELLAKAGCCLKGSKEFLKMEEMVAEEKYSSLVEELSQPRSLKVLSRTTIRTVLGTGIHRKLKALPIPQTLMVFLTVPEIA